MDKGEFLDLRPLVSPRSVAVVGASKGAAYGDRFILNLRQSGFPGKIYLVNPKYDHIDDMVCYPSLEALPEPVDLAAIIVSPRLVLSVLEQCVQKGIKAAVIISAGFAEAGHEGRINQKAIRDLSRRHGLMVCGPNCLGIANAIDGVMIHSYGVLHPWPGNIGLVSQSGALAFASILSQALDRGISFSYVISSGNEAALESIDYIRYFIRDRHTQVICAFLEGFKEARRFLPVADEALEAGKPLIVCKVGRSALGSRQAISHTGSMTGSDAVYQAVFDQKGIIRVSDPDDLFEVASIFSRCPKPRGEGPAEEMVILTTSGGMGSLLADKCGFHGIQLPPLSEQISHSLSEAKFLLVTGELVNPVDIRGQGAAHLPELLQLFIEDDRYHILLVALGLSAVGERSTNIARDLMKVASNTDKPLIVLWTGTKIDAKGRFSEEDGFRLLEKSNIPIFYSPEKCIQALRAFIFYHRFQKHWPTKRSKNIEKIISDVDASAARSFLEGKEGPMDEWESRRLLSFYGIPIPREKFVNHVDEAVEAAVEIGYPVVLKVISPDLPHKTEAGGVRLSIMDEKALRMAYAEMAEGLQARHPGARIRGFLVQEMISGSREMIVGFSQDQQFGPVVMCGLGGVFTEVLHDVSRRVPPLTLEDAQEMIRELKGAQILESFRGQSAADLPALLNVILRVGRIALDLEDRIAEMEINPLMVKEKNAGVCAVDTLVVLKSFGQGGEG